MAHPLCPDADIHGHVHTGEADLQDGPPDVTANSRSVAVLLLHPEAERLPGQSASGVEVSVLEFMQASPLVGLDEELVFERDTSPTREASP
jgi:hypothetical protein